MATEKLNFNVYDSGWESGVIGDIDEAIADADGNNISTTTEADVTVLGVTDSAVADADTVTAIDITVRARTSGSGNDAISVELLIGGVVQGSAQNTPGLTGSFQNFTVSDVAWDADRTASEMDGLEVRLTSLQFGMPVATGHEVDCCDVDVVFTLASGATPKGPLGLPLHGPLGGPIGA